MAEDKGRFISRLGQRMRHEIAQVIKAPANNDDIVTAHGQLYSDDKGAFPRAIIAQILMESINMHLTSFPPQGIFENDQRN